MVKIILASKSKVRKQILDDNNISTEVQNSNLDEDIVKEGLIKEKASPELISKNLAELKANKVSQKNQGFLVIGADSVIDLEGELISKPINRDQALEILKKQALIQASAGADFIGPSDMMDGRVGAIRTALDSQGFSDVGIISYTAKYSSAYYGPFRTALDSAPRENSKKIIPNNKSTYQMDPANSKEALIESALDQYEGADILMVKPGISYLDIVYRLSTFSNKPIAAYNVSGEYSMVKSAAMKNWINEKDIVLETLLSFKRAGAKLILTYHACDASQWLQDT